MFSGCNVAETFGVGHTNASCSVRQSLGPVTHDELAKDINEFSNMIAFLMDEPIIKEMDILVRYWSEKNLLLFKDILIHNFLVTPRLLICVVWCMM